jgi:hypothetical protein
MLDSTGNLNLDLPDSFVTETTTALQGLEVGDRTTELHAAHVTSKLFALASDPAHKQV